MSNILLENDIGFVLKGLTGTQKAKFKIANNSIISENNKVIFQNNSGFNLLEVSIAKLKVSDQSIYWGHGPLVKGLNRVGDIVLNTSTSQDILCWRCIESGEPGIWQAHHITSNQLPSITDNFSVAFFNDGWSSINVDNLSEHIEDKLKERDKYLVNAEQLLTIYALSGINTGDETKLSIESKLGVASTYNNGYLSSIDYDRFNAAYGLSLQLKDDINSIEVFTRLSQLENDEGYITNADIPTALSSLENDIGYITSTALPTKLSELQNDVGFSISTAPITRLSELQNDVGYITDINLSLQDLLDVSLSSTTDNEVLTYDSALAKWVSRTIPELDITTDDIIEGSNKYFTVERLNEWAVDYIQTINLRDLADVADENNIEDSFLYFRDGRWHPRKFNDAYSLSLNNLNDVVLGSIFNWEVLTYNNGYWGTVSLSDNLDFNVENIRDIELIDLQDNQILVYDSNRKRWINSYQNTNESSGTTVNIDGAETLAGLNDVSINSFSLNTGSVLTYNASTGKWGASNTSNFVTSVNNKTGVVNLTTANIPESPDYLYYTDQRATDLFNLLFEDNSLLPVGNEGDILVNTLSGWIAVNPSYINSAITLDDLLDVSVTGATDGQILIKSGSNWIATDGAANYLDDLLDVTITTPTLNQVLFFEDSINEWINYSLTTDEVTEGTNLYYTDLRVENYLSTAIEVIPTAAIEDDAITFDKLQEISDNTFIGNISGATANPALIYFGSGFNIVGNTVNVTVPSDTFFLDDLADVSITSTPTSGSVLIYDSITGLWEPAIITTVISVNGLDGVVSLTTSNIPEGTSLYYTNARADARIALADIDDLADVIKTGWAVGKVWGFDASGNTIPIDIGAAGSITFVGLADVNITSPVNGAVIVWDSATNKFIDSSLVIPADTDDLPEGSTNLYFTNTRVDNRLATTSIDLLLDVDKTGWASGKVLGFNSSGTLIPLNVVLPSTTDDLPEGSLNKYYSNTLVNTWANATSVDVFNDVNTSGWAPGKVLGFNASGIIVPLDAVLPSTTDDLPEGVTNKYYSNTLVNTWANAASIDVFNDVNKTGWIAGQVLGFDTSGNLVPVTALTGSITTDSVAPGTNPARQYYSNTSVESYLATIGLEKIAGPGGVGGATPLGGQALVYNSTTNKYEPGSVSVVSITQNFNNVGDTNGLIYWAGTSGKTQPFSNPSLRPPPYTLTVTLSSNPGALATSNAIDRNNNTLIQTASESNARFVLDLGADKLVKPNHYTIRGRSDSDTRHPRNWKFQGSMDGLTNWVDLDDRVNNTSINQNTWFSGSCTAGSSFRYLSILLTGPDSSGTNYLTFSEFEVYGSVTVSGVPSVTTTDDLVEGLTNLYYTDGRVQTYLDGVATISGSKLNANSIGLDKLTTIATNSILGRYSAGTGNIETITLGTGLSLSGSTLNVSIAGGVTSVVGLTGDITAVQIGSALNLLTGTDRLDYNSLKNIPAVSSVFGAISQNLVGNITLTSSSEFFQVLNPNGSNRNITLDPDWTGIIVNDSIGNNNLILLAPGGAPVVTLSNSTGVKAVWVWYDGAEYVALQMMSYGSTAPTTVEWGNITGVITNQTDLVALFNTKLDLPTGTTSQYVRGDGSLATFPSIPTLPTYPEIAAALNLLTGADRVSYTSLKDTPSFATVATSGSYVDLSNKPTIPTLTSQLTNDAGFLTTVDWSGITGKPSFATVATSGDYNDLSSKPTIPTRQKGAFGINIQSPTDGTRILFTMPFATTVVNFNDIKTTDGTCTLNLRINGVSVTPMSAIAVTSTPQNITATANNIGSAGNRVELVVSANSSGANLTGTLYLEADL